MIRLTLQLAALTCSLLVIGDMPQSYRCEMIETQTVWQYDQTEDRWNSYLTQQILWDDLDNTPKVAAWRLYKPCNEPRRDYTRREWVCKWKEGVEVRAKLARWSDDDFDRELQNRKEWPEGQRRLRGIQ